MATLTALPSPAFSAVVLAAGRSTRMGSDKALLTTSEGQAFWERQRDLLTRAGATEIFLSARSEYAWANNAAGFAAVLHDKVLRGGPLAGIAVALERATQPHLAVLAVDLPRMEPVWFRSLLAECAPGVGVVGRHGDFYEPLAAIYPRELLPLAQAALAKRELSLQTLLAVAVAQGRLKVRAISREEAAWFENRNEPVG